jgi:hypothetical protein
VTSVIHKNFGSVDFGFLFAHSTFNLGERVTEIEEPLLKSYQLFMAAVLRIQLKELMSVIHAGAAVKNP